MNLRKSNGTIQGFTLLIVSISLANFMSAFDATIVNVALPTISKVFNVLPGTASWLLTVYVLIMAGFVLIFGKISDIIGFKKMFLSGFLIFTIGSFACGFLPGLFNSFSVLIGSRALQALGASMITAIGPAMVAAYIPVDLRGKAMGTIFTFAALGMALGPTVGGILTQYISWSWIFYINIPIGIGAILLGAKVIPEMESGKWRPGFDRTGAILIFVGLASLLFAFSKGLALGWTSPVILGSFILAIFTLAGFVWCELKAPDPLLEIRLFKQKNFVLINIMMLLMFFAFNGILYLIPFYLQLVMGYTPSFVGLIFTSFPVAIGVGGILAGIMYNRTGGRMINIAAWVPIFVGYFLITRIRADTNGWFMGLCLVLIGLGSGLMWTSGSNMVMNSVGKNHRGMISSFISLARFLPVIFGVSIFNVIFMLGIPALTISSGMSMETLANIRIDDLSAGFEVAFMFAFIISIFVLAFAFLARQEVHPDSQAPEKSAVDRQKEGV